MSLGSCVGAQNREEEAKVSLHPEIIDGTVQTPPEQVRVSAMDSEEITSPTRSPISSYAAMTDPDEGTSLTFVQSQEFNGITYAIAAVAIYSIRTARNEKSFSQHLIPVQPKVKLTKDHVTQSILILNSITGKYTNCTGKLVNKDEEQGAMRT
ncbi:LOW QUALITY PROTEIN: hypothetical protein Cgig2_023806 [Carnegiea gigantea]|uniref:Uncharacterized protein n=1 Tax=Carnegiea gigantea TaxID=171969 RepID=A0A9Q1GZS5_9CARY|nr:LOW QUALITY PROTEIN: hypothetical protein Cgig2_023806 [Carnegiea gigantea]